MFEFIESYKGCKIEKSFGFFHVCGINCFGANSIDHAKAAIDRYRMRWPNA